MKKDAALERREQVLRTLGECLTGTGLPIPVDDGKLYHEEVEGENRWAQRLSVPNVWPHAGSIHGQLPRPGLRYEVWYFQKREELWMGLLSVRAPEIRLLTDVLRPEWTRWVEGGKFARRYQLLNPLWRRSYPDTDGIWCEAREARFFDKFTLLVKDTLPILSRIVDTVDPEHRLPDAFKEVNQARDPLQELAARFSSTRIR